MGDEAGQPLNNILLRKEMERLLGDGMFMWGIGNALGKSIWSLVEREDAPKVFFSKINTKAKQIDIAPSKVYIWTSYLDKYGDSRPVPDHVLLTSRANAGRQLKRNHFALVCQKRNKIEKENLPPINFSDFKNINSNKGKLGYSQVTAIVERNGNEKHSSKEYPTIFSADLVKPYYVKLINPVELPLETLAELNCLWDSKDVTLSEWNSWLTETKKILQQYFSKFHFVQKKL